jgi:hypothetical protein
MGRKKERKTTQTMSAWVKEVWMPQNQEGCGPTLPGWGALSFEACFGQVGRNVTSYSCLAVMSRVRLSADVYL